MSSGARAYLRFDWRLPDKFHCVGFSVTRLNLQNSNLSASASCNVRIPLVAVNRIADMLWPKPRLFVVERRLGCCHGLVRSPKPV
jgi:hypothetical protein